MNDSRKWAGPIFVGAVLCSVMLAFVTWAVGDTEFYSIKALQHTRPLPFIAYDFGKIYVYGWILPIVTGSLGLLVWNRRLASITAIARWLSALLVVHVFWLLFALFALYLANPTMLIGDVIAN
jgi:hypothetical protein